MILADSSIWIDHFRNNNNHILQLVQEKRLLIHPFVIGELALGSLAGRREVLADLQKLSRATTALDAEVMMMIERDQLYGKGIGYVDAHLLASARLTADCKLWSKDKRLRALAEQFNIAASFDL